MGNHLVNTDRPSSYITDAQTAPLEASRHAECTAQGPDRLFTDIQLPDFSCGVAIHLDHLITVGRRDKGEAQPIFTKILSDTEKLLIIKLMGVDSPFFMTDHPIGFEPLVTRFVEYRFGHHAPCGV